MQDLGDKDLNMLEQILELTFLAKVVKNPSFCIMKNTVYSETEMQGPTLTPCLCC